MFKKYGSPDKDNKTSKIISTVEVDEKNKIVKESKLEEESNNKITKEN